MLITPWSRIFYAISGWEKITIFYDVFLEKKDEFFAFALKIQKNNATLIMPRFPALCNLILGYSMLVDWTFHGFVGAIPPVRGFMKPGYSPYGRPPELMADEHEYRLMSYLLDNYNKAVRPAKNHTEPLAVTLGVALTQLIDVRKNPAIRFCEWEPPVVYKQLYEFPTKTFSQGCRSVGYKNNKIRSYLSSLPLFPMYDDQCANLQRILPDEKNQIMTVNFCAIISKRSCTLLLSQTNCWLNQVWMDHNLKWKPESFGNITTIRIPSDKIWKPDLLLYNNADSDYYHKVISTNAIVKYDGNVTWLATTIFRSSCEIDVRYFPFDLQNCTMKFASWTYDGYKVDLVITTEEGDLTNYVPSCEWDIVSMSAKRTVRQYSCCPEPYPDITITLIILRKPLFYVFNYLMPCALITILAFLGFYTPSESGEKVTLGITTLLSMTVFLMMVGESMPPTSESLPLIAVYYGITIFLVALATAVQVLTLNMHHRGTRGQRVPNFLKVLVLGYMAPVLQIHIQGSSAQYRVRSRANLAPTSQQGYMRPATRLSAENLTQNDSRNVQQNGGVGFRPQSSSRGHERETLYEHHQPTGTGESFNHPFLDTFERQFLRVLNKVYQTIERNEMRLCEQDHKDSLCLEWQEVALVLDRLLLLIFFVATVLFSGLIIFNAPHARIR